MAFCLVPSGLETVSFRIASSLLFAHLSSASSLFQRLFSSLTHPPLLSIITVNLLPPHCASSVSRWHADLTGVHSAGLLGFAFLASLFFLRVLRPALQALVTFHIFCTVSQLHHTYSIAEELASGGQRGGLCLMSHTTAGQILGHQMLRDIYGSQLRLGVPTLTHTLSRPPVHPSLPFPSAQGYRYLTDIRFLCPLLNPTTTTTTTAAEENRRRVLALTSDNGALPASLLLSDLTSGSLPVVLQCSDIQERVDCEPSTLPPLSSIILTLHQPAILEQAEAVHAGTLSSSSSVSPGRFSESPAAWQQFLGRGQPRSNLIMMYPYPSSPKLGLGCVPCQLLQIWTLCFLNSEPMQTGIALSLSFYLSLSLCLSPAMPGSRIVGEQESNWLELVFWINSLSRPVYRTTKQTGLNWTGPSSSRRKKRSSALDPHHPLVHRLVDPAKEIRALSVCLCPPLLPHHHHHHVFKLHAHSSHTYTPRLALRSSPSHAPLHLHYHVLRPRYIPIWGSLSLPVGASSSSPSPSVPRYNTASTARLWNASIIPSFFILLLTGQLAPSSETNSPPLSNNSE
ncbi:uncharacterized protein CLUP02_02017 [Colletotrichum lupini]|uniref:Uncharacterized protein n=1 Tax=Colletotrichum lupini TaxID=145971 RepID=A0A9Q8SE30_9PEZI|nr:uncharacterized protein CLUP02_02017 [Colletotrichum lupini]UQC75363.1 hypothetical protein CLUP02_02017 [Colletotrichum lupini]